MKMTLGIAPMLMLALTTTACGTMWKNLKQQNSEWMDDAPPPPMVLKGDAVTGFLPLARDAGRFRAWQKTGGGGPVVPETAKLIDAYPVFGNWDFSRDETGNVIGRVGYMAVLYQDGNTCVWVRGRYYETQMGGGEFGALDLAEFDKYAGTNLLPEVTRAERRHKYPCEAKPEVAGP